MDPRKSTHAGIFLRFWLGRGSPLLTTPTAASGTWVRGLSVPWAGLLRHDKLNARGSTRCLGLETDQRCTSQWSDGMGESGRACKPRRVVYVGGMRPTMQSPMGEEQLFHGRATIGASYGTLKFLLRERRSGLPGANHSQTIRRIASTKDDRGEFAQRVGFMEKHRPSSLKEGLFEKQMHTDLIARPTLFSIRQIEPVLLLTTKPYLVLEPSCQGL